MTTIAYRDGIMAADSRTTVDSEAGGSRHFRCEKLYAVKGKTGHAVAIVGLAGESAPGLVFLDWYRSGAKTGDARLLDGEADFTALVLTRKGLFEYDKWCRGERVQERFYAIGSGAKAALGAMHMGADARKAVMVACRVDPFSAPPIVTMAIGKAPVPPSDDAPDRPMAAR